MTALPHTRLPSSEQDESDDDDDDAPRAKGKAAGPRYTAKDLAGLAVSHGMDDIEAGESMILTLKDSRIIGQDGELEEEDVLENVRVAELRKRDKALKAAKKMTAFEETDVRHSVGPPLAGLAPAETRASFDAVRSR